MSYEEFIEDVSTEGSLNTDTLEAAEEAMGFVLALHNMFKENGVVLPEEPDCSQLESLIDGIHGELAAACLFLAEDSFAKVPSMLRGIAAGFDSKDVEFTDPEGETGSSVPPIIRKGFLRLADRIEATREQMKVVS